MQIKLEKNFIITDCKIRVFSLLNNSGNPTIQINKVQNIKSAFLNFSLKVFFFSFFPRSRYLWNYAETGM